MHWALGGTLTYGSNTANSVVPCLACAETGPRSLRDKRKGVHADATMAPCPAHGVSKQDLCAHLRCPVCWLRAPRQGNAQMAMRRVTPGRRTATPASHTTLQAAGGTLTGRTDKLEQWPSFLSITEAGTCRYIPFSSRVYMYKAPNPSKPDSKSPWKRLVVMYMAAAMEWKQGPMASFTRDSFQGFTRNGFQREPRGRQPEY